VFRFEQFWTRVLGFAEVVGAAWAMLTREPPDDHAQQFAKHHSPDICGTGEERFLATLDYN
jgi:hypothetical protein